MNKIEHPKYKISNRNHDGEPMPGLVYYTRNYAKYKANQLNGGYIYGPYRFSTVDMCDSELKENTGFMPSLDR